jgi:hypothetical protein
MKKLLLYVLWAVTLDAQSISITKPAANEALTGWSGNTFTVSYSGADIVEVCYTVDAYAAYNPGIDAPTTLGCSITRPFSYPYNSFWNLNGPHQVVATAYNALGQVVATSSAVPFTTANSFTDLPGNQTPVTNNPTMAVSTTCPAATCTVTATVSGSPASTDSLTYTFFVNGIIQSTITNSTGSATGTLYTTQFPNGSIVLGVNVLDNTHPTTYTGDIANNGYIAEWSSTVTLANGAVASQALLNQSSVYLAPGGTFTLTAKILNTDGSTTAYPTSPFVAAPVFQIATPSDGVASSQGGYLQGITVTPLTKMQSGIATVNASTGVVTAVAPGAAVVNVMTPTITISSLAVSSSGQYVTSSALTPQMAGGLLNITGGSGCRTGPVQMSNVSASGQAFLGVGGNSPIAPPNSTCTATTGPTRQAWVYVANSNVMPCFGTDGSIQSTYNGSLCRWVVSIYGATADAVENILYDQYANSNTLPLINASGINTLEWGAGASATGTLAASTWESNIQNNLLNATYVTNNYPKFSLFGQCASLVTSQAAGAVQPLWALNHGAESSPTYIGSQTAWQWAISQYINQGHVLGCSWLDEGNSIVGSAPLQGPITFSNNGTLQSGLQQIVCSSGVCYAQLAAGSPTLNPLGPLNFIIHGSGGSGDPTGSLNSVAPAVYQALLPSGATCAESSPCTVTVSGGGSVVTVTIFTGGSHYQFPPFCFLLGGGGTYTSCTTTVSGGSVTGVTVTGASGYLIAPTVQIEGPFQGNNGIKATFYFNCSACANGTYNASNDPGLTIEPYVQAWFDGNTQYATYADWAGLRTQSNVTTSAAGKKFWFSMPVLGSSVPTAYANWNGNPNCCSTATSGGNSFGGQTISGLNSIIDANNVYVPSANTDYIQSRRSANGLLNSQNQGYFFKALYGVINQPAAPTLGLAFASGAYSGISGYIPTGVAVVSCVGNTITFSGPHLITNIVPGVTRLWITGATDGGSATDSCNNNFIVLAAPTPTTLTVLLGATDFVCAGGGTSGTCSFQNGGTITFDSTCNPSLEPCTANISTNGSASGIYTGINAAGTAQGQGVNSTSPTGGTSIGGNIGGDLIQLTQFPGSSGANVYRNRGRTFTLSNVSGTPTVTMGAGPGLCLIPANCGFNYSSTGAQFLLLPENLNLSSPPANNANTYKLVYRQIPRLSATGGTATIVADWKLRPGASAQQILNNMNPGYALGTIWEALTAGYQGVRVYKYQPGFDAYTDQLGYTGTIGDVSFNQFANTEASIQPYMNEQFENGFSVPAFHAASTAGLMTARYKQYILQPALNAPDTGFSWIDCMARHGSYGDLVFCLNASDGPQTVTLPLTPYETTGQNIIQQIVNDHSIGADTIISAGTTSATITLNPTDAVFLVFPASFAAELQQPWISPRVADVTNATSVVIHFAYDPYYLDAAPNIFNCGSTFPCQPAWDRNIGTVYYRLIYLGSNSQVLATSGVQTL